MRRCSVMVRQRGGIVVVSSPIARRHWVIITNRWCVKHSWIMWSTRTNSLTHILRLRLSSVDRRIRHWLRYFCAKIIVAHSDVCDDVVCRGGRASPSATPRTVWETAGFGSHYTAFRTNQKLPKLTHTYTTTPTLNSIKSISIRANTITWRIYIACSHYINLCGCGCVCVCVWLRTMGNAARRHSILSNGLPPPHTHVIYWPPPALAARIMERPNLAATIHPQTHTHTLTTCHFISIYIYIFIFLGSKPAEGIYSLLTNMARRGWNCWYAVMVLCYESARPTHHDAVALDIFLRRVLSSWCAATAYDKLWVNRIEWTTWE